MRIKKVSGCVAVNRGIILERTGRSLKVRKIINSTKTIAKVEIANQNGYTVCIAEHILKFLDRLDWVGQTFQT